jgi:hypothetical protein
MSLEIFYEKVAEGLVIDAVRKVQAQGQTNRPANRLVGREQFIHRSPVTRATLEGKSQSSSRLCAEKNKLQTGKTVKKWTTTYCRKCDLGPCIGQCLEVYHSKLNYWE